MNQPWVYMCSHPEPPSYRPPHDDPVCETAKETQMSRTVFWTLWEKAMMGWFERIALKHVYYHM